MKLQFKNIGQFLEESSSRYEAQLTPNLKVQIAKCDYTKEWRPRFKTVSDYTLDYITDDFIACNYTPTKRDMITALTAYISDADNLAELDKKASLMEYRISN